MISLKSSKELSINSVAAEWRLDDGDRYRADGTATCVKWTPAR